MADIEQIKAKIDLRDLISESCKLDSGGRGAHENKHDSKSGNCLYVDTDWWICHHCNAGGDALDWIMDRDGVDFLEALRTAAEIAGISLNGTDPKAESERRAVFDVLKAAAVHFNDNLTATHRADITARWGITDQTIDNLLIGIARNDDALEAYLKQQGFTHDQMVKSGVFFDWDGGLKPHFRGRYVFPYWKGGTVWYMIARQTNQTPKGQYEAAKYKKLLTHNDKHPYVSEHVRNDTLYGVDALRGVSDWCLITEGVTDCIMAYQAGIPCISPVTTKFRKADHKRILNLVNRLKTVYICNDNETNDAGLEGAIGTAEYLEADGVTTRLVTLPRPDGVDKIDLAEYLRDRGVDEFKALFDAAVAVWNAKLSRQHVSSDAVENVKTVKKFITDGLSGMDAAERVAFIESDVKAHFGLSGDVVKELVKIAPAAPKTATPTTPEPNKTAAAAFDVLPDTFLVGENRTFDVNKFAKWILNESGEHFVTLIDNEKVFRYSDGVYVTSGEAFIKQMTERVMNGFKVTKNAANEIIGHIQRRTYTERDEFDSEPDVINMRNGLYHIKSGEFEQHTPDYLSLSKMDVKYDPDAKCETIDRFIKDVVAPKRVDAIFEIAGYTVLPEKRLKRGVIFVGEPDTGKSTMISTISAFVGENHISDVSPDAFGNDNHASFDLYGKLLNRIDDLGTTPIEDTGVLKSVVSSAPIRANQKYGMPFSFVPKALVLFGCNQVPACSDKNMRDKFDILMFENVHSGKNIDPELPKKLTTDKEMSGLFNKAMVAVKTAIENRTFTGSYTLYDRQKDYEYHSNPLARFVDECCDLSNNEATTDKKLFRKIYIEWSKERDFTIVPVGRQTTYLQDKGVVLRKIGQRDDRSEIYVGIDITFGVRTVSEPCPKKKPMVFPEQEAV